MENQIDIFVISLKEAAQRRLKSGEQLDAAGLPWSFFDAINGWKLSGLPPEYDQRVRRKYWGHDLSPGELGCFLSHREGWKRCVQTQRPTMILEDDFYFQQAPSGWLSIALKTISDWDVLRLQGIHTRYRHKVLSDFGKNQLAKHYCDPIGTTAYIVKPASARILLEKTNPFHAPVDEFFSHDWIHRLKILSILPFPIVTTRVTSTIWPLGGGHKTKLSRMERVRVELVKLPRVTEKTLYQMRTFPALFFAPTKRDV